MQLIDSNVTLNGHFSGIPFFFPATFFFLSNVVLLSMYFLNTYLTCAKEYVESFLDVDTVLVLFTLMLQAYWDWFKWFSPPTEPLQHP